jgi:hypothetical protein
MFTYRFGNEPNNVAAELITVLPSRSGLSGKELHLFTEAGSTVGTEE